MTPRRAFLLRIDAEVLDAVQRWANDDLRSLNGQVEFLLRAALRQAGRTPRAAGPSPASPSEAPPAPDGGHAPPPPPSHEESP